MRDVWHSIRGFYLSAMAIGAISLSGIAAAQASCLPFNKRATPLQLQAFQYDPTGFLRQVRGDTDKIEGTIALYIATDPKYLPSVRVLVSQAPATVLHAIGAGLGRVVQLCSAAQPQDTRKIFDFVHDLGDFSVAAGFSSVTEDGLVLKSLPGPARPPNTNTMMTGDGKVDILDPFAEIPVPE